MKLIQTTVLLAGLVAFQALAQTNAPAPVSKPDASAPDKDKLSYAIGMSIGGNFKRQEVDVDIDTVAKAMKDVVGGGATKLTEKESMDVIRNWQMSMHAKIEQKRKEQAEKNGKDGDEFIAKKAKEPGVTVLPSGLAYKVIKEGNGPTPKSTDTVTANYRGTLIDGTEFDSSYTRNQPLETAVTGVIPGWTEALQAMKVGSKWELYIPYKLAYGEYGRPPKIGPKAALVFEMELLSIKPPKAATADAVSGEIIKVPSADELKKGAKIEVIKPNQADAAAKK